ncbi:MAG: class IV adenylate cyclase [Planctomycetota bacterium]|jgi:predicted adenylyl cyclase CyaB
MAHVNIEIKARCGDSQRVRTILDDCSAEFIGTDHQVDTYFRTDRRRLKLRQGNIENSLIYYDRPDTAGPKRADVALYRTDGPGGSQLHEVLGKAMDVAVVVEKQRDIYFIDNVKFHIDQVEGLGSFVEIEAIDATGELGIDKLRQQCDYYIALLEIRPEDLVETSYSNLLLKNNAR